MAFLKFAQLAAVFFFLVSDIKIEAETKTHKHTANMATELLYSLIRGGRSTITTRELSRASGIAMPLVESALLSEAESNGASWDLQFTVSFKSDSVDLGMKRFQSQRDAQVFASEGPDRNVQLHSVSVKDPSRSTPLSMSELITQRFGDISLQRSGSLRVVQDAYPLLSRQATIEKSMSSGDLAPQTLTVKPASNVQVPAQPKPLPTPAAVAKVVPAPVVDISPVAVRQSSAPAKAVSACDLPPPHVVPAIPPIPPTSSAHNEEVSTDPVVSSTPANEETLPAKSVTESPKVIAENVVAPLPHGGKVQKSLFDMMKPVKRSRDEGAADATVVTAPPKVVPAKKPAAPAKAPKAKPLKETKSLAKLASRNGNKDAVDAKVSSSLVLDAEEQDDSDAEREDDDHDKYLAQVLHTPPRPRNNAKASKIDLSNVILPCDDEETPVATVDDDFILGDAATLIRQPVAPAAASPQPQSPSPGRFAPKTIAPQKRPREAAEAVPMITGNLDSFFNTELFAFQQLYTHEHKSECAVINGEYIFNDVTFYQHKETKETLTEEQYQAKQRSMIAKFEEERAAKKKLQQESQQQTTDETSLSQSAKDTKAAAPKDGIPAKPAVSAKATKAAAAPPTGPKQTTLFSFMKKN
jgi:hypothetical protein